MNEKLMNNLKAGQVWKRGLFMLLFAVIYSVIEIVLTVVVLFQFFYILFTGTKNQRLLELGKNISAFILQILEFLTFNSEYRPYPLGDWPVTDKPASTEVVDDDQDQTHKET